MLNYLIRQFGMLALGMCILFTGVQVQDWVTALHQNTAQIASAVTCHAGVDPIAGADRRELQFVAMIDRDIQNQMNMPAKTKVRK